MMLKLYKFIPEILEYVGGYLMRKAFAKYGKTVPDLLNGFCQDAPQGEFSMSMQKPGCLLLYPSTKMLGLLLRVYYLHNREIANKVKDINFFNIYKQLNSDPFYNRFVETQSTKFNTCQTKTEDVVRYIMLLFIKVLGHNFAKHLLQKYTKQSAKLTRGLRGDLKVPKK